MWADYDRVRNEVPIDDDELLDAALDVLETFADLAELARNRPAGEEEQADERVHSPREFFHSYLKSLDVDREGLPEAFRARLAKVLAHYGVTDLEPSDALEEAVYRIFLAQERVSDQIPIIAGLLERWRTRAAGHERRRAAADRRRGRAAGGGDPAAVPADRRPRQEHPVRGLRAAGHRGGPRPGSTPTSGRTSRSSPPTRPRPTAASADRLVRARNSSSS